MIIVREARSWDAQAVIDIFNPIIEEGKYTVFDTPFSVEEEREFIENFPERGLFLLAEEKKKVLGFHVVGPYASYKTHAFDHVGLIGTFIDPAYRRKGIGSFLFSKSCEYAIEKGYETFFGYVRADNLTSLAFHRSLGFEIIGTAKEHAKIEEEYIDEVFIRKPLKH